MKPGPSSFRFFSNSVQSTISGVSSVNANSPSRSPRAWSHLRMWYREKGKLWLSRLNLAAAAVERVAPSAKVETHRHGPELQVATHRIEKVAAIAFGKLVGTVAGHDEGRGAALHLGDVAQLDPLAAGRRG